MNQDFEWYLDKNCLQNYTKNELRFILGKVFDLDHDMIKERAESPSVRQLIEPTGWKKKFL
jgi:hypothetical protein